MWRKRRVNDFRKFSFRDLNNVFFQVIISTAVKTSILRIQIRAATSLKPNHRIITVIIGRRTTMSLKMAMVRAVMKRWAVLQAAVVIVRRCKSDPNTVPPVQLRQRRVVALAPNYVIWPFKRRPPLWRHHRRQRRYLRHRRTAIRWTARRHRRSTDRHVTKTINVAIVQKMRHKVIFCPA